MPSAAREGCSGTCSTRRVPDASSRPGAMMTGKDVLKMHSPRSLGLKHRRNSSPSLMPRIAPSACTSCSARARRNAHAFSCLRSVEPPTPILNHQQNDRVNAVIGKELSRNKNWRSSDDPQDGELFSRQTGCQLINCHRPAIQSRQCFAVAALTISIQLAPLLFLPQPGTSFA